MIERYWLPMSWPCPPTWVGSCTFQKKPRMRSSGTTDGSKSIFTTSAWPVPSVHTCSYVGFASVPPEYPHVTWVTPGSSL